MYTASAAVEIDRPCKLFVLTQIYTCSPNIVEAQYSTYNVLSITARTVVDSFAG